MADRVKLRNLLNDPEYQQMDPAGRLETLRAFDTEFGELDEGGLSEFEAQISPLSYGAAGPGSSAATAVRGPTFWERARLLATEAPQFIGEFLGGLPKHPAVAVPGAGAGGAAGRAVGEGLKRHPGAMGPLNTLAEREAAEEAAKPGGAPADLYDPRKAAAPVEDIPGELGEAFLTGSAAELMGQGLMAGIGKARRLIAPPDKITEAAQAADRLKIARTSLPPGALSEGLAADVAQYIGSLTHFGKRQLNQQMPKVVDAVETRLGGVLDGISKEINELPEEMVFGAGKSKAQLVGEATQEAIARAERQAKAPLTEIYNGIREGVRGVETQRMVAQSRPGTVMGPRGEAPLPIVEETLETVTEGTVMVNTTGLKEVLEKEFGDMATLQGNLAQTQQVRAASILQKYGGSLPEQIPFEDAMALKSDMISGLSKLVSWQKADVIRKAASKQLDDAMEASVKDTDPEMFQLLKDTNRQWGEVSERYHRKALLTIAKSETPEMVGWKIWTPGAETIADDVFEAVGPGPAWNKIRRAGFESAIQKFEGKEAANYEKNLSDWWFAKLTEKQRKMLSGGPEHKQMLDDLMTLYRDLDPSKLYEQSRKVSALVGQGLTYGTLGGIGYAAGGGGPVGTGLALVAPFVGIPLMARLFMTKAGTRLLTDASESLLLGAKPGLTASEALKWTTRATRLASQYNEDVGEITAAPGNPPPDVVDSP
jgi:hypothetical protein